MRSKRTLRPEFTVGRILRVAVFLEDIAQKEIICGLIERVAADKKIAIEIVVLNDQKGASLGTYYRYLSGLKIGRAIKYDVVVVSVDANCSGYNGKRKLVEKETGDALGLTPLVLALPEPHIECWYLLDCKALATVGNIPTPDTPQLGKCEKDVYKKMLRDAFIAGGIRPRRGGAEYGGDLAKEMDVKLASKRDNSFKKFIEDIQSAFKSTVIS